MKNLQVEFVSSQTTGPYWRANAPPSYQICIDGEGEFGFRVLPYIGQFEEVICPHVKDLGLAVLSDGDDVAIYAVLGAILRGHPGQGVAG